LNNKNQLVLRMKSPFKFLDSYTRDDREIFFGRDREIEEMYQKVFEGKILLVYGISGTGKTSLINCGLANKFEDSDWLPVSIRRGRNILESFVAELQKVSVTKIKQNSPPGQGEYPRVPGGGGGCKAFTIHIP
jgi:Cdc6-like AAA superfamily ATPase